MDKVNELEKICDYTKEELDKNRDAYFICKLENGRYCENPKIKDCIYYYYHIGNDHSRK